MRVRPFLSAVLFLPVLALPWSIAPRSALSAVRDIDESGAGAEPGGGEKGGCPRRRSPEGLQALLSHLQAGLAQTGAASLAGRVGEELDKGITGFNEDLNSRRLRENELAVLREIFGESLNPAPIKLVKDRAEEAVAQTKPNFQINLSFKFRGQPQFEPYDRPVGNPLILTELGMSNLVHEAVHVWQMQNGRDFLARTESALRQARSELRSAYSDCDDSDKLNEAAGYRVYDWWRFAERGVDFEQLNHEAQARLVEDWYRAQAPEKRGSNDTTAYIGRYSDYVHVALRQLRAGVVDP